MMDDTTLVSISKQAVHCDLEEEVVILGLDDGVYYGLNPVAAFIWNTIQTPHTVGELKEKILAEYDVTEDICQADLLEILQKLLDNKLIEIKND